MSDLRLWVSTEGFSARGRLTQRLPDYVTPVRTFSALTESYVRSLSSRAS